VLLLLGAVACTARNPAFEGVSPPAEDAELALPDAAALDLRQAPPGEAPDRSLPPDVASPDAAAPEGTGALPPDAAVAPPPDVAPSPSPDLAADRGPPGAALLVVGDTSLSKSDTQLKSSLIRLGFTVVTKDGSAATADDATGRALVVISGSSWSDDVGGKFRDVTVPVVVFDDALFGPMKMTGTRSGTDFGQLDNQTRLMIIDDTHPLAGGLSGLVTVATANIQLSWGVPGSAAIKVATIVDQPTHFTIFGYPEGSTMVGMSAPARRVGSFVRFPSDSSYSESGLLLFEASALWAIGHLD
jgi:hypothetical protein